jgi:hypothetical protein
MRGGVMKIDGGSLPSRVTFQDIIDTVGSNPKFYKFISKDWMNSGNETEYGTDQNPYESNPSIISMRDAELTENRGIQYLLSKWRSVRYPSTLINHLLLKREFSVDDIVYILFHNSIKQFTLQEDLFKPIKDLVTPTEFNSIKSDEEALKTLLKEKSEIKKAVEAAIREKYLKEQDSNNRPLTALIGRNFSS